MKRSQSGFTLVEVSIALILLAIGLVGLHALLTASFHANSHARHISASTNLARAKIEELRGVGYAGVTSGSDPAPLTEQGGTSGAGAIYSRSWAAAAGPTATTKDITVTVAWDGAMPGEVSLLTTIAE